MERRVAVGRLVGTARCVAVVLFVVVVVFSKAVFVDVDDVGAAARAELGVPVTS